MRPFGTGIASWRLGRKPSRQTSRSVVPVDGHGGVCAKRAFRAIACSLILPTPVPLSATTQSAPTVLLQPASRVFGVEFTKVGAVRELSDGRVVVLDEGDDSVVLLSDSVAGSVSVGRTGAGPGEYGRPIGLFGLPDGKTAVLDGARGDLLVYDHRARFQQLINGRWHRACSGARPGAIRIGLARAVDLQGRIYALAEPIAVSGGGLKVADSAAIERWTAPCRRDTLALVPNPYGSESMIVNGVVAGQPGTPRRAFPATVQWAVAGDGRIAIVRPDPYRVEVIDPAGRRSRGPVVRYERTRVTAEHRREWQARNREGGFASVRVPGRPTTRIAMKPPAELPVVWPEYLPPFPEDAVRFDAAGLLWVQRTTGGRESGLCDVFDEGGRLVRRVRIPGNSRVVGFGQASVYLARTTVDGLEVLERHPTSRKALTPTPAS